MCTPQAAQMEAIKLAQKEQERKRVEMEAVYLERETL
jgi:hypothetical protein